MACGGCGKSSGQIKVQRSVAPLQPVTMQLSMKRIDRLAIGLCPMCNRPLHQVMVGGVEVTRCGKCGQISRQ